jgi:hypothetical protein
MEKPWKVVAAFVGVFIAGSIFGGLLALRLSHWDLGSRMAEAPKVPPASASPAPSGTAPHQPPQITAATPRPAPSAPVPQLQLPPSMAVQAPQLMRRYVDKLNLSTEQKDRINPLIQRAASDLRRQQQTNLRETGIIFQHLQEDIAKELTPAQRTRLEEMAVKQQQIIETREKQQLELTKQEKLRAQQGPKNPAKDGTKAKTGSGKPPEDGN